MSWCRFPIIGRNGGPGGRFLNLVVVWKKSFNVMIRKNREMSEIKKAVIFMLISMFVSLGLSLLERNVSGDIYSLSYKSNCEFDYV